MSDKETPVGESFDLDRLKQLIRLMEKHNLTEVKLERGGEKWVLRRGGLGDGAQGIAGPYVAVAPSLPTATSSQGSGQADKASDAAGASEGGVEIKSPTVGTFYASPQPGDPPYVKVGDRVSPDTTVCIIEAMKVFNQIPAEVSGVITKILVNTGDAVEFGQALFEVKPS